MNRIFEQMLKCDYASLKTFSDLDPDMLREIAGALDDLYRPPSDGWRGSNLDLIEYGLAKREKARRLAERLDELADHGIRATASVECSGDKKVLVLKLS